MGDTIWYAAVFIQMHHNSFEYFQAQLRFKPGSKIADNLYVRQDGTRSYFFTKEEAADLFENNGFELDTNLYVNRRTINHKEGIDVPRTFLQGKYIKK